MPSVSLITLGCAKNEVDSNRMHACLAASGLDVVDDPNGADIIIVNTCSFITEATEEALELIFELLSCESFEQGKTKLVVAGCMPSRYGEALSAELPEVAAFVPAADEDKIAEVCWELLGLASATESSAAGATESAAKSSVAPQRLIAEPWAYVKISEGCSRSCAYCTIPSIRGPYRSFSYDEIAAEITELVSQGAHEIVLIGQDTGIWGSDFEELQTTSSTSSPVSPASSASPQSTSPRNLAELIDVLALQHPQVWFRIMYLQPQGITDELLATIARHNNICDYLDIPLQHANARVLKDMNRAGSGAEHRVLLERVRKALPNVTLRTTLIAGFPGEKRSDAQELKDFVLETEFDYVGAFAYSQEDGTAAGARSDQVASHTKHARLQRLRDAADEVGFARAALQLGREVDVLVCGVDEEGVYGRTQGQAPEVDGIVYITEPDDAGEVAGGNAATEAEPDAKKILDKGFVRVRIVDVQCYDLYGEVI